MTMSFFEKLYKNKTNVNTENSLTVKNSTSKYTINSGCTLRISSVTEDKKSKINEELKALVKKYINTPEKLMQYMQLNGLKIYKIKNASKILANFNEEEGFITPLKGFKAFILNLIIVFLSENKINISFSTKEMFIFNDNCTEIYTIARALHKYHGFKANLPGFDNESQEIFKKMCNGNEQFTPSKISDIYRCREALARDLESINFTIALSAEYERAKKVLNKIQTTNSATV